MSEKQANNRISPGDRFDRLTVLCDTGKRKNNRTVWECVCTCGAHVEKTSKQLTSNAHLSCGCDTPQQKLIGRRFGSLTVLENSGQHDRTFILWTCRCDCGATCLVNSHKLLSGQVTNCGCKSDLLGRQFGRLTVIGDEGTQTGEHMWRCRCSCGNECLATASHLTHGRVKSCGCLHDTVGAENLKLIDGTSVTKLEARRRDSDKLVANNTSGHNGVYPQNSHGRKTGRWVAQIGFKGRKYYLGVYDNIEDAIEARKRGEEMYDSFLEWYYDEYLPGMKETTAKISAAAEQKITDAGQAAERPRI